MTSNAGAGHVGPLVPFAHAFMRAGHEVLLAAPKKTQGLAERAGLTLHALADPPAERVDPVVASLASLPTEEAGVRMMREVFAGIDFQASLPGVLRALADFRPDVVLREPTEYAGLVAAERRGVRHGRVAIMAHAAESWGVPVVAPVLDRHRRRLGLRPDPLARRISDSPYLTVIPEAMEDPDDVGPPHTLRFREPQPAAAPLPAWWPGEEGPLVYVSYGSVTPTRPFFPKLFRETVAALGSLPARVLFTVGTDVDLGALAPLPDNVHVEPWIDQAAVMPHAAAMVGHGGAGSTRMSLAAGVPAVIVPAFADQPRNAERVAALGAGIALDGTPERLGDAVRRVLDEPSYRAAARRVAADVADLPSVDKAPGLVCEWLEGARAA